MGEGSKIAWTDHTFNPWWGCTRVSPGCQNCYAEAFAKRTGNQVWGQKADRRFFGDKHWSEPVKWDRKAAADGVRRKVFCASMADVFEARADLDEARARLWELIAATPNLDWLLLTKRPQNVRRMVPPGWLTEYGPPLPASGWPANVWVGTTVEDQQRANERIPELLAVPAPVRFLSCEPLLGPLQLDFTGAPCRRCGGSGSIPVPGGGQGCECNYWPDAHGIGWVIAGGESGPRHRPLDLGDARALRDACAAGGVPFFFKQVGGRWATAGGDLLDGRTHHEFPVVVR